MSAKPVEIQEDEYKKGFEEDPRRFTKIVSEVPFSDVKVTHYYRVDHVDDLTQKPEAGTERVELRVPVKKEKEVVDYGDDGEPLKNEDGTDKLTTETYIGYVDMEVDLSPASFAKLEKALTPFVNAAREVQVRTTSVAAKKTASKSGSPSPELTEYNAKARAWAVEVGHMEAGKAGRVPRDVVDKFERAHPNIKRPSA